MFGRAGGVVVAFIVGTGLVARVVWLATGSEAAVWITLGGGAIFGLVFFVQALAPQDTLPKP